VSYFTAVLAREGRSWTVHDLDVDAAPDLAELTVDLRAVAEADEPVLLLVEREDAWWAIVRVDGEEDPRVFVSDVAGAAASSYAEVLADLGTPPETLTEMCEDELLPMDALAAVAERAGFAEVLDALR